jgi:hypothetical protein
VTTPRGWAELAALGPLVPATPCGVPAVPDTFCGRPAIVWTTMRAVPPIARCADHPPRPGEWGHGLDWTPRICVAPLVCWCGRHPPRHLTPAGGTVVDDRAVASGKRRSTPTTYAEARARTDTKEHTP